MTNPYESPKTPAEPNEPPRITRRVVGAFLAGVLLCALITFVIAAIAGGVMTAGSSGPYRGLGGLIVFMNAPGIVGPVCGGILWALSRKRSRPFAIGAVATGVAAFLFVGGCLMVMSL